MKTSVKDKCDVIERLAALAVMTSAAADRKAKVGVYIQNLLDDVKACLNGMTITFEELRVRFQRWVNRGWGSMENNVFLPNKFGRLHLLKMAEFA